MPPLPANPEDDEPALIRAVQAGDTQAFAALLEWHLDAVRAFVALRLPVAHVVDELAHETFVFAYQQIARFTAGTSFRAWLRAIAANLIRAELQRYRRTRANEIQYAQYRVLEAELEQVAPLPPREWEYLQACVEALPAPMRELVALKYRQDEACADISTRLQRTETWVWQNLHRLRQQLRLCMEGKIRENAP